MDICINLPCEDLGKRKRARAMFPDVQDVRQTGGPTLFVLQDASQWSQSAAMVSSGQRLRDDANSHITIGKKMWMSQPGRVRV